MERETLILLAELHLPAVLAAEVVGYMFPVSMADFNLQFPNVSNKVRLSFSYRLSFLRDPVTGENVKPDEIYSYSLPPFSPFHRGAGNMAFRVRGGELHDACNVWDPALGLASHCPDFEGLSPGCGRCIRRYRKVGLLTCAECFDGRIEWVNDQALAAEMERQREEIRLACLDAEMKLRVKDWNGLVLDMGLVLQSVTFVDPYPLADAVEFHFEEQKRKERGDEDSDDDWLPISYGGTGNYDPIGSAGRDFGVLCPEKRIVLDAIEKEERRRKRFYDWRGRGYFWRVKRVAETE